MIPKGDECPCYCQFGPASVAQLDARLVIKRLWVRPQVGLQHSFLEIDHEKFTTVILSLLLIQECQFLAKECTQYWLTA